MSRRSCAATLEAAAQLAPVDADGAPGAIRPARQRQREESMHARVRGARWRHAAARLGAVAVLAGVLVGGGVAAAEVSHPTRPPTDPK
ncbi:MAG TPA: hypothetical protein VKG45_05740 [Actinomycetes bacterium]|nr:hypothetical protein [Actinomycetes bacterium]